MANVQPTSIAAYNICSGGTSVQDSSRSTQALEALKTFHNSHNTTSSTSARSNDTTPTTSQEKYDLYLQAYCNPQDSSDSVHVQSKEKMTAHLKSKIEDDEQRNLEALLGSLSNCQTSIQEMIRKDENRVDDLESLLRQLQSLHTRYNAIVHTLTEKYNSDIDPSNKIDDTTCKMLMDQFFELDDQRSVHQRSNQQSISDYYLQSVDDTNKKIIRAFHDSSVVEDYITYLFRLAKTHIAPKFGDESAFSTIGVADVLAKPQDASKLKDKSDKIEAIAAGEEIVFTRAKVQKACNQMTRRAPKRVAVSSGKDGSTFRYSDTIFTINKKQIYIEVALGTDVAITDQIDEIDNIKGIFKDISINDIKETIEVSLSQGQSTNLSPVMKQVYKACIMELMLDPDPLHSVESISQSKERLKGSLPEGSQQYLSELIDQVYKVITGYANQCGSRERY